MSQLVEAARAYLGVPWRHQGRSRMGLDCAGLIVLACQDCGIPVVDLKAYTRHPWRDGLVRSLEANFGRVDEPAQPGDILLFRYTREPQHLAIATDRGIIHSHLGVPGVGENAMDKFWSDRLLGVYRP